VLWSSAAAVVGIGGAVAVYGKPSALPAKLAQLGGPFTRLSQNKFYLDEVFTLLVVWPVHGFALVCRFLDNVFLDRGLVDGISKIPAWLGRLSTPMQNGLVQFYALAMMAAMVMLMWGLFWRQG
jgi:NADH-quinone oxidoreductase subunit L